jgi:hypothetical protein
MRRRMRDGRKMTRGRRTVGRKKAGREKLRQGVPYTSEMGFRRFLIPIPELVIELRDTSFRCNSGSPNRFNERVLVREEWLSR